MLDFLLSLPMIKLEALYAFMLTLVIILLNRRYRQVLYPVSRLPMNTIEAPCPFYINDS